MSSRSGGARRAAPSSRPRPPGAAAPGSEGLRRRLFHVIFEADTPAGKVFDVALIAVIALSILAVMLESVPGIRANWGRELRWLEWLVTVAFTIEYGLRLYCVANPLRYARSFFGVVDLLAVIPTYLSVLLPGSQSLLVIRALRLLRITRVFKLAEYVTEANLLLRALHGSRDKIVVFLMTVLILDVILGSLMYVVESPEAGFDSIPRSVYWAIVTMTTVGYGDIAPETVLGQMIAAGVMILGYSIIAVPTGIVTAGIFEAHKPVVTTRSCPACTSEGHEWAARYCKDCGEQLLVAEREALAAEEE